MFTSGNTLTLPSTTTFAGGSITGGTLALNGNTVVNGSTLIQATVADNGTIAVNAGTLDLGNPVTGNGQITINPGTGLELGQASNSTQRIIFARNSGALRLDQPGAFQSPVSNFQMGDVIDFAGLGATAALYSAGDLTLFNGTTPVEQLSVSTPYSRNLFHVASDGSGGTDVTVMQTFPAPTAYDFTGDKTSDILWQNTNGQAAAWLLNNTAPFNEFLGRQQPGTELAGDRRG